MATVTEETNNPPTPPADSTSFEETQHGDPGTYPESRRSSSSASALSSSQRAEEQTERHPYNRMSNSHSINSSSRISRPSSIHNRQSITHRLSLTSSIPAAQRQNLVSERLNTSHDIFLSHLASFIGRLHLQSQSSAGLLLSIRQSAAAGRALLTIVELVCGHDPKSAESLELRERRCTRGSATCWPLLKRL